MVFQYRVYFMSSPRSPDISFTLAAKGIISGCFQLIENAEKKEHLEEYMVGFYESGND